MRKRCVCLGARCVGWVCECVLDECVSVFVWVWCDCAHGLSGGEIFLGSRNINMDLENRSMTYKQIFKDHKKTFL